MNIEHWPLGGKDNKEIDREDSIQISDTGKAALERCAENPVRVFDIIDSARIRGCFKLSNGKESSEYFDKEKFYQNPEQISFLCALLAESFSRDQVDVVIPVGESSSFVAKSIADKLHKITRREVSSESDVENNYVLLVQDVACSGKSINDAVESIRQSGGNVLGIAVIVDRGVNIEDKSIRFVSLAELK